MEPLHGLYAAQSGQELYVQMLNLIYLSAPSYLCILKGRCNHQYSALHVVLTFLFMIIELIDTK